MPTTARILLTICLALITCTTACRSGKEAGSASHASVTIEDRSIAEIHEATERVFGPEGYSLSVKAADHMVFERPGSRRDALKWGGWEGNGVTMRVKIDLRELAGDSTLMQANAYAVQNASDPFFQSESRNILLNRRPYQKLLNKVKKQLDSE